PAIKPTHSEPVLPHGVMPLQPAPHNEPQRTPNAPRPAPAPAPNKSIPPTKSGPPPTIKPGAPAPGPGATPQVGAATSGSPPVTNTITTTRFVMEPDDPEERTYRFDYQATPWNDVLSDFARMSGLSFLNQPDPPLSDTLTFRSPGDMTYKEALHQL